MRAGYIPTTPNPAREPIPEVGPSRVFVLLSGELLMRLLEQAYPGACVEVDWGDPREGNATWFEPRVEVRR